ADLGIQPFGYRTKHEVAIGVTQHVVDLLEFVETEHEQPDLARLGPRFGHDCAEAGVEGVAVGEAGQRIVFSQIANSLGFAFPDRYVAQDRAILKTGGTLTAGETSPDREHPP